MSVFGSMQRVPVQHHAAGSGASDDIDFEIKGADTQYVENELDPSESAVADAGAMMFKAPSIEMQTVFGDGRQQGGYSVSCLARAGGFSPAKASNQGAESTGKASMTDTSLKTKLAFYLWLGLLLITLGTFVAGLLGHLVTVIAAPWLSLGTQAIIHAVIPVLLTAVKFVTVPPLLLLVPFAHCHPTFRSWTDWSKAKFNQLEHILKIPWSLAKAIVMRAKSLFRRREGKSGLTRR